MKKTLTVVTVCFNSEKTLDRCIKSVVSQLTPEVEYLIIDGASADRTMEIVQKYAKDGNLRYVSEKDNGIYDAMNKGIRNAHGQWIWFINSDDYISEGLIEVILSAIHSNTNVDCIYGNMEYIRNIDGKQYLEVKVAPDNIDKIKLDMVIGHPSTICRVTSLKEISGFDINFKIAADWDLFLRMFNKGLTFVHVDKTFSRFYCGGISSTTHTHERHLVRKKNKSYKVIDLYMIKDLLKIGMYTILNPAKDAIIKHRTQRI